MEIEPVTEGELSVLEVVWARGTPTSREIAGVVYARVTDSKMASVQKLLERLEAKGVVARDRAERAHRFRALVSREEFLRDRLRGLADRLCGGAIAPLVTTLLRSAVGAHAVARRRVAAAHRRTLARGGRRAGAGGSAMSPFWGVVASNAAVAAALAVVALGLGRGGRGAAAAHLLWVAALLKLFAPPLVVAGLPIASTIAAAGAIAGSPPGRGIRVGPRPGRRTRPRPPAHRPPPAPAPRAIRGRSPGFAPRRRPTAGRGRSRPGSARRGSPGPSASRRCMRAGSVASGRPSATPGRPRRKSARSPSTSRAGWASAACPRSG